MNIGIIGYGSMGKMILEKISESNVADEVFEKTLEKRRVTTERAQKNFEDL